MGELSNGKKDKQQMILVKAISSSSGLMQVAGRDEEEKKLPLFTAKCLPSVADRKLMIDSGPDPMASPFATDSKTTGFLNDESDFEGEEEEGDDDIQEKFEDVSLILHAYDPDLHLSTYLWP